MKKYTVTIDGNRTFESLSRNARKHLRAEGGNQCTVRTLNGVLVSKAKRDCDSPYRIYNCNIEE